MATTKRRTTTSKRKTSTTKQDKSLPARTVRTVKQQPYVSAAIATGAVTAVAAAVAGAFFFRRSGKTVGELTDDLTGKIKEGYSEAKSLAKDGLTEAKSYAKQGARAVKDKTAFLFEEDGEPSQSEIAEEALTLKQTGSKPGRPVDDTIDEEIKAGSVAY